MRASLEDDFIGMMRSAARRRKVDQSCGDEFGEMAFQSLRAALQGAKRPRIHSFLSTSPLHMKYKLQMTPEQVHQAVIDSITHARNLCDDVEWSPEDGSRTAPYPVEAFDAENLERRCFICQPAAFIRRDVYSSSGMLDPERLESPLVEGNRSSKIRGRYEDVVEQSLYKISTPSLAVILLISSDLTALNSQCKFIH